MNFRKVILSTIASTVICGNVYAGSDTVYLPLSTSTVDNKWVMFGVNSFSDGDGGAVAVAVTGEFTAGYTEVAADVNFQTTGTSVPDINTDSIAIYKGLTNTGDDLVQSQLTLNVEVDGKIYIDTEAYRTMYLDVNQDGNVDLEFKYKTSLEGKNLEIKIDDGSTIKIYQTTIDYTKTYSLATKPTLMDDSTTEEETTATYMTKIVDVLDYDMTDNPVESGKFDKNIHFQDSTSANANVKARFYNFDAVKSTWKLWDKDNNYNDFTEFEKGKAYWGKIDTDSTDIASNVKAGLILAKNSISQDSATRAEVYSGNLNEGWNFLSFDDVNPNIRDSISGVIATIDVDGTDLVIKDATGVHAITVSAINSAHLLQSVLNINKSVAIAKANGSLPNDFQMKAFQTSGSIVIISDKKFQLSGDVLGTTTTLAGNEVVDNSDNSLTTTATDISSVYGERALIVKALTGSDTAAGLDGGVANNEQSAKVVIKVGDTTAQTVGVSTNGDAAADMLVQDFADNINAVTEFDGTGTNPKVNAITLDLEYDGVADDLNDYVLIASNKSFYIQDNTFVKVFDYNTVNTGNAGSLTIEGRNSEDTLVTTTVTPTNGDSASVTATAITAKADTVDTGIYAYNDGTQIIAVSSTDSTFDIYDASNTSIDMLSDATSTHNVAKGAIEGVYSLTKLLNDDVIMNKYEITGIVMPSDVGDAVEINFEGAGYNAMTPTLIPTDEDDTSNKKSYLDQLVSNINTQINVGSSGVIDYAVASHDYSEELNQDFADVKITISGFGLADTAAPLIRLADDDTNAVDIDTYTVTEAANNPQADEGKTDLSTPNLTTNLKANAIYSPDYVTDGPLNTLKDAGYTPKSFVSATTDLKTDGSIQWNNIDLTANKDEWLTSNVFDLFNVSNSKGYWVYLDTLESDPVTIGTKQLLNKSMRYSFDNSTGVTTNTLSDATIDIEIDGISGSGDVYAIVGGSNVPLRKGLATYRATLSQYETSITRGTDITVDLVASNGMGETITEESVLEVDYSKPDTPIVSFTDGAATYSTSTGETKFFMFENYIPEVDTDTAAIDTDTYNICSSTVFNSSKTLKIVAVDGDGEIGVDNISNSLEINYKNTINGAHVLTSTSTDSTTTDHTTIGLLYDNSCTSSNAEVDNGVSLRTDTEGETTKLSFVPINGVVLTTDMPYSANVTVLRTDGTTIVELQILAMPSYAGEVFFVETSEGVFKCEFPSSDGESIVLNADDSAEFMDIDNSTF